GGARKFALLPELPGRLPAGSAPVADRGHGAHALPETPERFSVEGHPASPVKSVAFSPDGRSGLLGYDSGTAILWDLETGQPVRSSGGGGHSVVWGGFGRDGLRVVTRGDGGAAGEVFLWSVADGKCLLYLPGHASRGQAVFGPDGRTVLTTVGKKAVLWDAA